VALCLLPSLSLIPRLLYSRSLSLCVCPIYPYVSLPLSPILSLKIPQLWNAPSGIASSNFMSKSFSGQRSLLDARQQQQQQQPQDNSSNNSSSSSSSGHAGGGHGQFSAMRQQKPRARKSDKVSALLGASSRSLLPWLRIPKRQLLYHSVTHYYCYY
jgi:hypothetical protein